LGGELRKLARTRRPADADETADLPAINFTLPQTPAFDTYDIWVNDVGAVVTGIQNYDLARQQAQHVSGWYIHSIAYIYYGGFYDRKGERMPRALAAFRAGRQLPYVVRITSIASDGLRRVWRPVWRNI
jgi:hypothetical protein